MCVGDVIDGMRCFFFKAAYFEKEKSSNVSFRLLRWNSFLPGDVFIAALSAVKAPPFRDTKTLMFSGFMRTLFGNILGHKFETKCGLTVQTESGENNNLKLFCQLFECHKKNRPIFQQLSFYFYYLSENFW
jgi:hypothetical protein